MRRGATGTSSGGNWALRCVCLLGGRVATAEEQEGEKVFVVGAGGRQARKLAHTIQIRKRPRDAPSHPLDGRHQRNGAGAHRPMGPGGGGENGGSQRAELGALGAHQRETSQRFRHHQVDVQARGRVGLSSRRDFDDGVEAQGDSSTPPPSKQIPSFCCAASYRSPLNGRGTISKHGRLPHPPIATWYWARCFTNAGTT